MEIERLVRLDEEAILLEEDIPLVRSLSMSRNMALSMLEEVPHMIKFPSEQGDSSGLSVMKSSVTTAASTLTQLNINQDKAANDGTTPPEETITSLQEYSSTSSIITISQISQNQPQSFTEVEDAELLRTMRVDGVSVIESRSSLTSLSQIVYPSVRGVKKNELLTGIVVSRWDNIVGPQCIYLWTEEVTSLFYPGCLPSNLSGVVKYVTDHTVDHQDVDGNQLSPSTQRTTLCIVPELSLVYISISIRVPSEMETILEFASSSSMTANDPDQPATSIPHAVAVLANLKFLSHFLLLRPLLVSWLNDFAPKIGVLLCKNKLQSSMINSWCAELCKTMTALKTCWVKELPAFSDESNSVTIAEDKDLSQNNRHLNNSNRKPECKDEDTMSKFDADDIEYLPPNLRHVSKSAWGSLLSSHLSTFGSSIIVGFDSLAVNQVIRFLLCFSSNPEGYCSRYSLSVLPDTFMKGLYIQGLTFGGIGERSISFNQVASGRVPLTYVELGTKFKVKQMNPQNHRQLSYSVLMQELRALWTSSAFISPPDDPYPQLVKDAAGFVTQFLDDLTLLPSERRYGRILLFRRVIHSKAMTLITYLQSIRNLPKFDRIRLTKLIPEIFSFDEQEYIIIQVTAEKLKPGIIKLLYL